jgi:hypothetical protein
MHSSYPIQTGRLVPVVSMALHLMLPQGQVGATQDLRKLVVILLSV